MEKQKVDMVKANEFRQLAATAIQRKLKNWNRPKAQVLTFAPVKDCYEAVVMVILDPNDAPFEDLADCFNMRELRGTLTLNGSQVLLFASTMKGTRGPRLTPEEKAAKKAAREAAKVQGPGISKPSGKK